MLFNPLFVQIGVNTDSMDAPKSTKLNNTSYLFSDIIRIVNDNNKALDPLLNELSSIQAAGKTGAAGKLLTNFNLNTLSSQVADNGNSQTSVNLNDLLKKLLADIQSGSKGDLSSLENYLAQSGNKNIHLLSNGTDLDGFLQNLFKALPELKMVVGGDKNFIVKPVSGKSDGSGQDQKKQVEDAIINLLQTNSNIILNFNLGKDQFKIKIQKLSGNSNLKNLADEGLAKLIAGKTGAVTAQNDIPAVNKSQSIKDEIQNLIKTQNKTVASIKTEIKELKNEIQQAQNSSAKNSVPGNAAEISTEAVQNEQAAGKNAGLKNIETSAKGKSADSTAKIVTSGGPEIENIQNSALIDAKSGTKKTADVKLSAGSGKEGKSAQNISNDLTINNKTTVKTNDIPEILKKTDTAGSVKADAGKSGTKAIPDQNSLKLSQAEPGEKSVIAETGSPKTLTLSPEEQKYILSIKVNSSQPVSGEKDNIVSAVKNVLKDAQTSVDAPIEKNVNIDLSAISENQLTAAGKAEAAKTSNGGSELFNPPLTLKLSLKQQIKTVEQNKLDNTKVLFEKDTHPAQTQKLNTDAVKSSVNTNTGKAGGQNAGNNTQTGGAIDNNPVNQTQPEILNPAAEVKTDIKAGDPQNAAGAAVQENTDASDKNLNGTPKTKESGSNSFAKELSGVNSESEKPVLQPENNDGGFGNKTNDGKQNSSDFKSNTAQSIGDFGKFMAIKDNPGQFTSPVKTVNVSDLTKEFSKIISTKESKSVVLQLKPENMGKIKLSIDVTNNVVHARVEVENDQVKQMLQANLDVLRHSLNMNGLQLSAIDVSMSGGQQRSYKSYEPRKKFQYSGKETKISEEADKEVNRNMGYNTYEYLI